MEYKRDLNEHMAIAAQKKTKSKKPKRSDRESQETPPATAGFGDPGFCGDIFMYQKILENDVIFFF